MKKPNYGQQQKMKKLDPVALTEYCRVNEFEVPQISVDAAPLSQHPVAPEVVLTPVSDHEIEVPAPAVTEQAPSVITEVVGKPEPEQPMAVAAKYFFALKSRLEQNAAHSVLNWDEVADLEATLHPFRKVEKEAEYAPPKPIPLPEGQRWAMIVGEPMNRTQKFIRFTDDEKDAPFKVLFVALSAARMMGRKVRVKENPDKNQAGYILA